MFKIETNIPMPASTTISEMPFNKLEVGQSFYIPADVDAEGKDNINSKINLVARARKAHPTKYFVTKTFKDGENADNPLPGIRVWAADPANKPKKAEDTSEA